MREVVTCVPLNVVFVFEVCNPAAEVLCEECMEVVVVVSVTSVCFNVVIIVVAFLLGSVDGTTVVTCSVVETVGGINAVASEGRKLNLYFKYEHASGHILNEK